MKKNAITPAIIEEGVESAKNFLTKLITPAFEETGLLIKDQVTRWRFNNQVKMINKAKAYCEKNHINPKAVSLKLLVPLLDYSGIEENEDMQDKWAILLSNLVDSEQNIENHVFPYILSQLSSGEFKALELTYEEKQKRIQSFQKELDEFLLARPQLDLEIKKRIGEIEAELVIAKREIYANRSATLKEEQIDLQRQLNKNSYKEASTLNKIKEPASLKNLALKDFEISNLVRLGLIKEEKEYYAHSQTLEIPIDRKSEWRDYSYIDLDIDVDSNVDIILTELGELFVSACREKQEKAK